VRGERRSVGGGGVVEDGAGAGDAGGESVRSRVSTSGGVGLDLGGVGGVALDAVLVVDTGLTVGLWARGTTGDEPVRSRLSISGDAVFRSRGDVRRGWAMTRGTVTLLLELGGDGDG